jgi:GTPase SAR1 family protein
LIILCGNKLDLPRQVSNNEPIKLAEKEGLLYFELSAKTNENVLLMFYSSIAELQFFEQYDIQDKNKLIQEISKLFVSFDIHSK